MKSHSKNKILNEIKTEYESYNFKLSPSELSDYVQLSYTLLDKTIVDKYLSDLEKLLSEDIKDKQILANPQLISSLFNADLSERKRFKVLSDVLYNWAIQNKIVGDDKNPTFVKVNRLLSPHGFLELIKSGRFFKDIGTPPKHGAWTHFLQWFILIEHSKTIHLNHDIFELYKMIGEDKCIGAANKKPTMSVWFLLCDRDPNTDNPFDFRSPDNLHQYILQNIARFPFLSLMVEKGYFNDASINEKRPDLELREYKSNKIIIRKT